MPVLDPRDLALVARTRTIKLVQSDLPCPAAGPVYVRIVPKKRALAPGWDDIQREFPAKFLDSSPRGALCFLALDPKTPSSRRATAEKTTGQRRP